MGLFSNQNRMDTQEERLIDRQYSRANGQEVLRNGLESNEEVYLQQKAEREDLTRWQQDLDPDLQVLYEDMTGFIHNENNELVRDRLTTPLINERGAKIVLNLLKRYTNRNTMMSNYDETAVNKTMIGMIVTLTGNLAMHYKEYEIRKTNLPLIKKMVEDSIRPTLFRALNNGERKYLTTINKRVETYSEGLGTDKKNKPGLFKSLLGGGG